MQLNVTLVTHVVLPPGLLVSSSEAKSKGVHRCVLKRYPESGAGVPPLYITVHLYLGISALLALRGGRGRQE